MSDVSPGYWWAVFRTSHEREPEIVRVIDSFGVISVDSIGNDTPFDPEDFDFLEPVPPPAQMRARFLDSSLLNDRSKPLRFDR